MFTLLCRSIAQNLICPNLLISTRYIVYNLYSALFSLKVMWISTLNLCFVIRLTDILEILCTL